MDIVQIVVMGIVVAILAVTLKNQSPEIAIAISIGGSVLIFFAILPQLSVMMAALSQMAAHAQSNMAYADIVLKIVGIAYIAEFGAQICADAGEQAIASKIELGGKVLIMITSMPILFSLLDLITTILPY